MAQRLGEILIGLGLVNSSQVQQALRLQKQDRGLRLGEALVVMGAVDETEVLRSLARQQRVPFADPNLLSHIDSRLLKLVPRSKALHYALLPIRYIDAQLIVATCDADNLQRIEELVDALGHKLLLIFASRNDIQQALYACYKIETAKFRQKHALPAPKRSSQKHRASGQKHLRENAAKINTEPPHITEFKQLQAQVAREIIDELSNGTGVFTLTSAALQEINDDDILTNKQDRDDDDIKTDRGSSADIFGDDGIHEMATVYDQNLAQRLRADLHHSKLQNDPDLLSASEQFNIQPLTMPPQKAKKNTRQKMQGPASPAASAPPPPQPQPQHAKQSGGRDKPINRIPTGIRREKSQTLVRPLRPQASPEIPDAAALPSPRTAARRPRAKLDNVPLRQVQRRPQAKALNENFGEYLLLHKVATGGMAEVFEAQTKAVEGISRKVAIKRILPHLTDSEEFVEMFVDEAKITVQLNHVNIGQVYELGRVDDAYYISMEYISGRDLNAILGDAFLHRFAIPIPLATHIMQQVFEGLDYAHQKKGADGQSLNIVHRDVSPANVLCSFEGQVKVIDFGIAKAVSKVSLTRPGLIKGKISYMSPEQMRGEKVDHRSDIFAAGIIFYEMLSGQRLFGATSDVETIRNVLKGQVKAIRTLRPEIPEDLAAVVSRCLLRNPAERYDWASDASLDLQRVMLNNDYRHPRELLTRYMETRFGGLNAFEEA